MDAPFFKTGWRGWGLHIRIEIEEKMEKVEYIRNASILQNWKNRCDADMKSYAAMRLYFKIGKIDAMRI
jgi:hypothetical protein